jgi:hypothetical protein
MKVIASIEDPGVLEKILKHPGLDGQSGYTTQDFNGQDRQENDPCTVGTGEL